MWEYIAFCIVVLFAILKWKNRKLVSFSKKYRTNLSTIPFFGVAHHLIGTDEGRMKAIELAGLDAIEQNGLTSMWLAHRLYIVVADAEYASYLLKTCLEKDDIMQMCFKMVIGQGSITAPVHMWRPRRKILLPNFNSRNLRQFVNVFAEQSDNTVKELHQVAGNGPVSLYNYISTCTLMSIFETTLGVNVKDYIQPNQLLEMMDKSFNILATRGFQPWLYPDLIFKLTPTYRTLRDVKEFINNISNQILKSKRDAYRNHHDRKVGLDHNFKSLLDQLIESSGGKLRYTDIELREEFIVLVVAGTDTTAIATSFTMLMLSQHPDVQDKVYSELLEVFGYSTRQISAEDLLKLEYLEMVIKETMRLYPPVPIVLRQVQEETTLPSGITVPAGCGVVVNIWALHRNARYWGPDSEQFRPERFQGKNLKHSAQFIPFSNGPRNCAGYQYAMSAMKTLLATLLREFKIVNLKKESNLRLKFKLLMRDADGFSVGLHMRN